MPKVLVKIWEANGEDHWGKYPIDVAGNVLIKPIGGKGPGDIKETPHYSTKARRKTQGFNFPIPFLGPWRIWKQEYLEYPRGSNKFLEPDMSHPGVDVEYLYKLLENKAMKEYSDTEQKTPTIHLLTLVLVAALFFFLVVMPNFR